MRSLVCRPSTFLNIFFSETTGPIKIKFYMETPKDAETKVCSSGPGHMTKTAAMPIYGKKPFKKNLLLYYQKADDFGTWYVALGVLGLPSLFK